MSASLNPKRLVCGVALTLLLASAVAKGQSGPFTLPQGAQDAYDVRIAAMWAKVVPQLDASLLAAVKKLAGTTNGALTVESLDVASHDFSQSPRVAFVPIVNASGVYDGERLRVELPRAAGSGWSLKLAGRLGYDLDKKVLFFHVKKHFSLDVTLEVSEVHALETIDYDLSDPTRAVCRKTGPSQLDYKLKAKTGSALLNVVLFLARPLVDKAVRQVVDKALQSLDLQTQPLVGATSATPWGQGAAPSAPFAQQPDLERAALAIDDEIQSTHLPWGTILSAVFDDPNHGQGKIVGYGSHGDSAIWTGHYLAGEAFRYAVTKDPKAQANAARVLQGITDLLDVEEPGGGHLARVVIPLSDPSGQAMLHHSTGFAGVVRGQPYAGDGNISRDQYLGVVLGLGCAYDLLDDPVQKRLAGSLITRIVDYLVAHDWVAMQHDGKTIAAPFIQSPDKMVAFSALAAHVDPRFQAERDRIAPLVYVTWLPTWMGLLDPAREYYGWNLGNGARYHAMRLETDPARFMALERTHAIERRGIGHHENAWFQNVDAAVDPSLASTVAPRILDELRRFATRSRRQFPSQLSQDPTIEKEWYTTPLAFQKTGAAQGAFVAVRELMAKYPVPVERRCATDYLWQRNPFEIDGYGNPCEQQPGVDLVLPYWMARFYKLVP